MTYIKKPFIITKTNHLLIEAEINGIEGTFILDTGAGRTCTDEAYTNRFNLDSKSLGSTASSAWDESSEVNSASGNHMSVGSWDSLDFNIIIMDLSSIILALIGQDVQSIHGIIGSDLLIEGKAFINYEESCLYLQK